MTIRPATPTTPPRSTSASSPAPPRAAFRSELDLAPFETAPLRSDDAAPPPPPRPPRERHDGAPAQRARHRHAQGRPRHRVPRDLGLREVLDRRRPRRRPRGARRSRASATARRAPRRHCPAEAAERRGPIRRAIDAIGEGVPIVAVHMTAGLVDEWVMGDGVRRARRPRRQPRARPPMLDRRPRRQGPARAVLRRSRPTWRLRRLAPRRQADPRLPGARPSARSEPSSAPTPTAPSSRPPSSAAPTGTSVRDSVGERVAALPGLDARVGAAVTRKLTS